MIQLSLIMARAGALFAGHGLKLGIAAAVVVMGLTWDRSRVNKGRQLERAAVETRGNINAKKADAVRRSVERLPAASLCDKYSRDC